MLTVSIFSVPFSGTTGAKKQVHDILFVEKLAFFVAHMFFSIKKKHVSRYFTDQMLPKIPVPSSLPLRTSSV